MSTKLQFYSAFAERTARQITGSYRSWTAFLATAARLYKYPYNEQLMIYAQRPNATACAEYDFWKDRMGRYVQRGSTGIALIDTSGYGDYAVSEEQQELIKDWTLLSDTQRQLLSGLIKTML